MRQYEESLATVAGGLKVDSGSAELAALKIKVSCGPSVLWHAPFPHSLSRVSALQAQAGLDKLRAKEAAARLAVEREEQALAMLWDRCSSNGAALGPAVASDGYQQEHKDKLPKWSETENTMDWPMLFLYPQYQQSDFIEAAK